MGKFKPYRGRKQSRRRFPAASALPCMILVVLGFLFLFFLFLTGIQSG